MRGDYGMREFFKKQIFSVVSTGNRAREGGMPVRGREKTCVAIARRMGGGFRWFIYTPAFTAS